MTTRSVAFLVLVAVFGLTVAPFASGAVVATVTDATDTDDNGADAAPNESVSTFMQASAADAESTVDAGVFAARYDRADNETKGALVLERTDELVERLEALEDEREELREREDQLHRGEYQSRMTRLAVEIRALEREIDRTERRANESGVDDERLGRLRENAANLSGPEVAEIARGLGNRGDPPGQGPQHDGTPGNGPPTDETNARSDGQGNPQSPGNADADRGPSDGPSANESDDSSPDRSDGSNAGGGNGSHADRGPADPDDQPGSDSSGGSDPASDDPDAGDTDS